MSLAVFDHVSLYFGGRRIVDDLDLRVADGDRVGLIGPNGSGKSTLLKLLAGEQAPDSGKIILRRGARLGYLPQDLSVSGGRSLRDFVLASVPGRAELDGRLARVERELEQAQKRAASEGELSDLAEELSELYETLGHFDEHFSEHEALRILAGLGFTDADKQRDLGEFSGGWKMRAVLAALLFQQPDLLLLDEPTNHLDMASVTWFSGFMQRYRRAFVLISHDRDFLNEQIARVVSLEVEGVRQYSGNYDQYLKQRAEEELILENKAKNLAREREQAQRFIDRFRAQANKASAVQSRVKQLEKMESVQALEKASVMRVRFPPAERCSNDVLLGQGLEKSYGAHRVLAGVDVRVTRGQRIAIVGPNGAGKTTLLRILAGELAADAGVVKLGHHVQLGYFAQHHADTLDTASTPYQEVAQMDPQASVTRVRSVLGAFLFRGDDVDKKIGVLSGGERARVALARMLMRPGNCMLMDEPTNHLDLASSEALAESLASYDGTLLFVSHNRSFVKRLATQIWNLEGGQLEVYPGTLEEYLYALRVRQEGQIPATQEARPSDGAQGSGSRASGAKASRAEEKERKRREADLRAQRSKQIGPLKKRSEKLEARIDALEAQKAQVTEQLSDPAVYEDAPRRNQLLRQFEEHSAALAQLSAEWEAVNLEIEEREAELSLEG